MLLWLFGRSVMSDSLQPHGLQHASLPCPSLSPGDCSNSCPLSHCCHPTILSSVVRVFSSESALHIRWSKYWSFSFSISSSNECSGLVSFRIDWFDLLAVQGALKSLLQHHRSKASILQHSAFFMINSHIHIRLLKKNTTLQILLWGSSATYDIFWSSEVKQHNV